MSYHILCFKQGALAIRRIYSLVGMITDTKFKIDLVFLKLVWFGSTICIVSIKIRFKAINYCKAVETCTFYSHPQFYVFILGAV